MDPMISDRVDQLLQGRISQLRESYALSADRYWRARREAFGRRDYDELNRLKALDRDVVRWRWMPAVVSFVPEGCVAAPTTAVQMLCLTCLPELSVDPPTARAALRKMPVVAMPRELYQYLLDLEGRQAEAAVSLYYGYCEGCHTLYHGHGIDYVRAVPPQPWETSLATDL